MNLLISRWEVLSLLISIIALVISCVTMRRTKSKVLPVLNAPRVTCRDGATHCSVAPDSTDYAGSVRAVISSAGWCTFIIHFDKMLPKPKAVVVSPTHSYGHISAGMNKFTVHLGSDYFSVSGWFNPSYYPPNALSTLFYYHVI